MGTPRYDHPTILLIGRNENRNNRTGRRANTIEANILILHWLSLHRARHFSPPPTLTSFSFSRSQVSKEQLWKQAEGSYRRGKKVFSSPKFVGKRIEIAIPKGSTINFRQKKTPDGRGHFDDAKLRKNTNTRSVNIGTGSVRVCTSFCSSAGHCVVRV